jgi:hypothetical protein
MKTKNSVLCIAVVVLLLSIIMPAYGAHVGLEKRPFAFIDDDNSLLLLDCFTDENGNECIVLYDLVSDCFWIGPAPMRPYEATYINNGDSLDITSGDSPDINYSGAKAAGTRVRKQMQIIK